MKTDRSLNFFCHLMILFIHQFQSLENQQNQSFQSKIKKINYCISFHIIIFHYFSIKSEND